MTPWLQMQAMLLSGETESAPGLAPYQLLLQGDPEGAVAEAQASNGLSDELLRMAAASDGASDAMIAAALELAPDQGISRDSIWTAIGFAMRHGDSVDEYLDNADAILGSDAAVVREFFASLPNVRAAEDVLRGARSSTRGAAYAAGVVALGDRAPSAWREGAKRLLFVTERPYFR